METESRWSWRFVAIGFTVAAVAACALAAIFGFGALDTGATAADNAVSTARMTAALGFATTFAATGAACGVLSIRE